MRPCKPKQIHDNKRKPKPSLKLPPREITQKEIKEDETT